MLSWLTFSPLLVVVPILLTPSDKKNVIRWLAVLGTVPALLLAFFIFATFNRGLAGVNDPAGFQYVIQKDWIQSFHIQYYMGLDGLSVSMVLLTALLCFLCMFASWGIDRGLKGYNHSKHRENYEDLPTCQDKSLARNCHSDDHPDGGIVDHALVSVAHP